MKIIKCGLILLITLIPSIWTDTTCKTMEELDDCAYEISFLENRGKAVPTTDAQLLELCGKAKSGVTCLRDWTKDCFNSPMKAMVNKFLTDVGRHLDTHCDSTAHRADFLRHVACFTDPTKAEAVRLFTDKQLVIMEKIRTIAPELRIGGGCCSAIAIHEASIRLIAEMCSSETGDYFNDLFQEVADENMQIVCSEYLNMDKCNAKYEPTIWEQFKAIIDSNEPSIAKEHKYKTAFPIFVEMMQNPMAK